jgi:hypothetical protein
VASRVRGRRLKLVTRKLFVLVLRSQGIERWRANSPLRVLPLSHCSFAYFSCFRCMFHLFTCGYCICCDNCTRTLQASIPNVSSIFCTLMLQVFQTHVSNVSFVFFCILQVLCLYVSKVDYDVAHTVIVFLYVPNVLSVLDICCIDFI